IFTPELIAEAILHAAERPGREMIVGGSVWQAIIGQKVIPGLLDRYLARKGYDAQQTDYPVEAGRPDNLYDPVPGDYGAHGPFLTESKGRSLQLWVRLHQGTTAAAALAGLAAVGLAALGSSARR
ncbi:MAG TPA: short-chain dehydrogenase, partial [Dehalococcoidia bacterium]|nr:short-chain dehydrogenase [Dehalococcoidia bacterium]